MAARLATISGLRVYSEMPGTPEVPAAAVMPRSGTYPVSFQDHVTHTIAVWLFANPADTTRAQVALDAYLAPTGAQSVRQALEETVVTAGVIDAIRVDGYDSYATLMDVGGSPLLTMTVMCTVFA
jgi:hypothetical protein